MSPGTDSDLATAPATREAPSVAAPAAGQAATAPAGPDADGRAARTGALVLVLLSAILYWPTLQHELVYDDWFLIPPAQNESMRGLEDSLAPAFRLFAQEYWDGVNPDQVEALRTRGQALYRPLTLFLWAVLLHYNGYEGAHDALPYHLLNLLVNAWVVYLMFSVVRRLFGSTRLAFVATLLYALHPLHSEAVAYVAGLSDMLAGATVLLGLSFWLRATDGPTLRLGAWIGLLLTTFVGLLAKEAAVLVIAAVALSDLVLTLRGRGGGLGRRVMVYGGLLAVLALHLAVRWQFTEYLAPNTSLIGRMDNVLIAEPFDIRAMNAFKLIAKYTWLFLWPAQQSIDYSYAAITVSRAWGMAGPLSGLVLVGTMLLVGLLRLRRWPAFAWGLIFFVGTTVFTSNMFVPIGTIFAERLMYTPTIGACVAAGAFLAWVLKPSARPDAHLSPLGLLLVVLLAGGLGLRTWVRNQDFRDSLTLFQKAAEVVPASGKVHYQLGAVYATQGLFDEAIKRFEQALECDETFLQAAIRLGDVQSARQVWDKAAETYSTILTGLDQAARQGLTAGDPTHVSAVRAMVLTKRANAKRQMGDMAGATKDLEDATGYDVEGIGADAALAELLQGQEKWAESIPVLRKAIQEMPKNVRLLTMLTRAAAATRDTAIYEEALAGLEASDKGRPVAMAMKAEVQYERAVAAGDAAERDRAMELFDQALALDDTLATPYFYRGRYMVESAREFYDAIVQYDRALANEPDFKPALLYKALAQMQIQRYEDALVTIKKLETVNPGQAVYALMGETYFMLGDIPKMEQAYAKMAEYGEQPVQAIVMRAKAYQDTGDPDKALDILNQAFVSPTFAADPEPWKHKGLLLLQLGRPEEALSSFDQQRLLLDAARESLDETDAEVYFVGLNRARCLMELGRDTEAAAEIDGAEVKLGELEPQTVLWANVRASVLRWRATLLLRQGGPYFDATAAEAACEDGIGVTKRRFPTMFELSVEARTSQGDLLGAAERAREAAERFPPLAYFATAGAALEQAAAGDRAAALATLRGADNAWLARLAERLGG